MTQTAGLEVEGMMDRGTVGWKLVLHVSSHAATVLNLNFGAGAIIALSKGT